VEPPSVYILDRVVTELIDFCKEAAPNETLGLLLGFRNEHDGHRYVRIVDWVSGSLHATHVSARFTEEGIVSSRLLALERHGKGDERPRELGLFHSHPFGHDPHFSGTDMNTFLTFPYDYQGNPFILIDPTTSPSHFKVYTVQGGPEEEVDKDIVQVDWAEYGL